MTEEELDAIEKRNETRAFWYDDGTYSDVATLIAEVRALKGKKENFEQLGFVGTQRTDEPQCTNWSHVEGETKNGLKYCQCKALAVRIEEVEETGS